MRYAVMHYGHKGLRGYPMTATRDYIVTVRVSPPDQADPPTMYTRERTVKAKSKILAQAKGIANGWWVVRVREA